MPLREPLRRQPRWLVVSMALMLVMAIGWVDYVTGWEWSFFIFYAVPIVMVVWVSGQRLGFVFAVLCAITWWLAQIESSPYQTHWGFGLAVISRLFYFGILVIAVSAVEAQRELDRKRIASLERTQQLEREILQTSEREKQRIGRDLHDSLGPHLAAIGYAASFLASDLQQRDPPDAAKAEKIRDLVGEAMSLTRDLARGILPVMDGTELATALDDLANASSRLTGLTVSFRETGKALVADSEAATHLYRIAQEALNNAAKHAGAKNISIGLSTGEGSTRLVIADDGRGMSSLASGTRGIGLDSMKYRARTLGGELKIESDPNGGTVVTCKIPEQPTAPTPAL